MNKVLRLALYTLLALVLTSVFALVLIVKFALAPSSGEWSERVRIIGPVEAELGMPTVLRLATVSWFAPWLSGHTLDTRFGPVLLGWNATSKSLVMTCAPCQWSEPELGDKPIALESFEITASRDVDLLTGTLRATPAGSQAAGGATDLRGRWNGRLTQKGLSLSFDVGSAPIAQWYQLLAPGLPELQRARISGTATIQAKFSLPERTYSVKPSLTQFSVEGLGVTSLMVSRAAACGPSAGLSEGSWVAKAALGALDPEYKDHPGYDPASLMVASEVQPGLSPASGEKPAKKRNDKAAPKAGAPAAATGAGGAVSVRQPAPPPTLDERVVRLLLPPLPNAGQQRLRELLYVAELERSPGKDGLLAGFLDMAPWGDNICGAEAAARRYFKRSANGLAPAQAVWLATLLDDPAGRVARWQSEGQIDRERARQVVQGMKDVNGGQRAALYSTLSRAKFPPP
ncbi:transglycosylase domain-containing protein [Variovorax dokdonensis]|uniref:Transglycosylase domain-containing protein n=1 Tax=Variovorax dokdonensis TaxID=344883 RepID=A0ABT7NG05_9BURK|nr:transglycosylase domain-containing protein [Variovorax dokdonensis]MDM0046760.1 transglycosylase domain-containing protein [Variovorax dokdonensis]